MKDLAGLLDRGEQAVLLVPVPTLLEDNARVVTSDLIDPIREVADSDLPSRRDVDGLPDGFVGRHTGKKTVHDVAHVREVARLVARASDGERLSVHRPEEEVRDDVAIL